MANVRSFAVILILLIIVNCALIQASNIDNPVHREKRFFGCSKGGKRCGGFLGKSCCQGLVCNTTTHRCVCKGSSTSWLCDRNGK